MPYLTFATRSTDEERKKRYDKLEEQYKNKVLHGPRTLDQFYYYSLSDTSHRDDTQVVSRYFEEHSGSEKKPKKILEVDQLWLWVIDESRLSAFCTTKT